MTLSSDKVETVACESKANILKLFKSIGNSLGNAFWSYFDLKMNNVSVEKWLFWNNFLEKQAFETVWIQSLP